MVDGMMNACDKSHHHGAYLQVCSVVFFTPCSHEDKLNGGIFVGRSIVLMSST